MICRRLRRWRMVNRWRFWLVNLYDFLLIDWNFHSFWYRNWIWNFYRNWNLDMFLANLFNDLGTLFIVRVMLNNFIISFTLLLKGLNTFFFGNIYRCLIALRLNTGPDQNIFTEIFSNICPLD